MKFKGSKTEKNLYKTFSTKARNYTRYSLFSEKARIDGYRWIQNEFEMLANNELAHAREAYAAYLNLLGKTTENIEESIYIENLEKNKFYEAFEIDALEEGFKDVVPYFKGLSQISDNHSRILTVIDKNLKKELSNEPLGRWMCMNCGYIYEDGSNNMICPVCKYARAYYKPYD